MSLIQDAVQEGLGVLRSPDLDIQKLATYQSCATPSYDPATGAITSPTTVYPDIPVIFTSFKRIEIDGEAIRAEDQKVLIATQDLIPTPTVNDTIIAANGTLWSVMGIRTDPAGAAWVLQVRRP